MTKYDNLKKAAMIQALEKCLGVVSEACRLAEISRNTHYLWYKEDEQYRAEVDSIDDLVLDFAESKLHSKIDGGDTIATIFFLKTKGKKRGYIEKSEIEHTRPVPVVVDWNNEP